MVLALLVMGLGCSEEPREPTTTTAAPTTTTAAPTTTTMARTPLADQWSHQARQPFVDGCVDSVVPTAAMAERGVTSRDACRCMLYELEAEYTESDFLLLSDDEKAEVVERIAYDYGQEIVREIGDD